MNSPDEREELLAKLRAIDNSPAPTPPITPASPNAAQPAAPAETPAPHSADLLAALEEIDRETQHLKPKPAAKSTATSTTKSKAQPTAQPVSSSPTPKPTPSRQNSSKSAPRAADYPIPNALEQLALYAREKLEARAEERRQRHIQMKREDQATAWLEQLDPYSDDGFWFEQFAENYSSRIQAAIDFLDPDRP